MSDQMSEDQFNQIMHRFEKIEERLSHTVTKSDVFQTVMTALGFSFAIIVGVIVVLNSVVGFG